MCARWFKEVKHTYMYVWSFPNTQTGTFLNPSVLKFHSNVCDGVWGQKGSQTLKNHLNNKVPLQTFHPIIVPASVWNIVQVDLLFRVDILLEGFGSAQK